MVNHRCEKCGKDFGQKSHYTAHLAKKNPCIIYNNKEIIVSNKRELEEFNWEGIDLVLEATGAFTSRAEAAVHLEKGAKSVLYGSAALSEAAAATIASIAFPPLTKIFCPASVASGFAVAIIPFLPSAAGRRLSFAAWAWACEFTRLKNSTTIKARKSVLYVILLFFWLFIVYQFIKLFPK
jgi:hypothetical protein